MVPFRGTYFCMGAYKCDIIVVITNGWPIFKGCLLTLGTHARRGLQ